MHANPTMNAAATHPGRPSGFPASLLPDGHRSEAFVEDLFDCSSFFPEAGKTTGKAAAGSGRWNSALLCGVPLLVALVGGVLAFFHTMG